jgi:ATP phosphoribosyltransferase regulatory subunit
MDIPSVTLRRDEEAVLTLRSVYEKHGYTKYRMSKFEEYDFYGENKSFLQSDRVLTFTDLSGKLMALKPDITLSIVKNTRDGETEKAYYCENVYRADDGGREFCEIMQVGLECIGHQDAFTAAEVISLAEESLALLSDESILDVSHMGLIMGLLDATGLGAAQRSRLSACVGQKNAHELRALCAEFGVAADLQDKLVTLTTLYGPFESAVEQAKTLDVNDATHAAIAELEQVFSLVRAQGGGEHINLDFSIVNDMNYYNGIIFQGFIQGIPCGVLSGGSYDNLLRKLGKSGGAIGFAVYLGLLERYMTSEKRFDADVLLLYGENADLASLARKAMQLRGSGKSVRVQAQSDGALPRCAETVIFEGEDAK